MIYWLMFRITTFILNFTNFWIQKSCSHYPPGNKASWRRSNEVSLYVPVTSQVRLRWNTQQHLSGTRQDISVVRLHDVLLVCHGDVSRERNDDVPSVRLHDVSNKSQMKHPKTSQWYVTKTSQWYVSTTSH